MKKMYLIISLFVFSILAKAQTKEIEYYKDPYCNKKTNAEKGKFQLTTLHYADGSVETIKQKINDNKIIEHFKNDEPIGLVGLIKEKSFTISPGDPLVVVFPFKRDDWQMNIDHIPAKNEWSRSSYKYRLNTYWAGIYAALFHSKKTYR
jgi:hypothetical protein